MLANSIQEVMLDAGALHRLTPRQFEELIAEIWDRFGYQGAVGSACVCCGDG
jgi:restriction endonuclease Mrr